VKSHSTKELKLAIEIVENLLQSAYILPHKAQETFA